MLELLEQLFRQVRAYTQSENFDRNQVHSRSGTHITMQFDWDAEDLIIQGLTESKIGFEIITEERATLSTIAQPQYRIVIDPVDGSDNMKRGIMTAAVALAVLPIDAPIAPENVQWALVGELASGTVYEAQKGRGAFCNGRRCQVSDAKRLRDCLAGLNVDGRNPGATRALLTEGPTLKQVRRSGSSAMDSAYVASGAYDAYIDIGNVLTGESLLASASIVLEGGGIVSNAKGKELAPIKTLNDTFSVVMAGTRELHQEILNRLKDVV